MKCRIACLMTVAALAGTVPRISFAQSGEDARPISLKPPFRLEWVRYFEGERLGTAMEPTLGEGAIYVATHQGNLYALDAVTGTPHWRFSAKSPFLHSPAYSQGLVCAGTVEGTLYGLDAKTGKPRWTFRAGSMSAAPAFQGDTICIGTRTGRFIALHRSGKRLWEKSLKVPIRQTARITKDRVYVTGEDLRVRCFSLSNGRNLWVSPPLNGQTVRDYPPIFVQAGGKKYLVVRTNPLHNMAQRISEDRHVLSVNAGIDDNDWRKIDAWIKSDASKGSPELWEKEQAGIVRYLQSHPDARTFFILDAEMGKEVLIPPVLWAAGCQGVGTPPVVMPDGRLLVFYRSAYGNWNHGVAPLVALGILDLARNRITPLFHNQGRQPPWNTFWGTADETENFTLAGNLLLIAHQGTLSGFDLKTSDLFPIRGERDTYGGFRNLPWARNEWHGPARSRAIVSGNRVYWQTGSRILYLVSGQSGKPAEPAGIIGARMPGESAPALPSQNRSEWQKTLDERMIEALSRRWKPLYVEPGLAGREFFFDDSGDTFLALSSAYPYLSQDMKAKAKARLAQEWEDYSPYTNETRYPLTTGEYREYFQVSRSLRTRLGSDRQPPPFGSMYSVWLYAKQCGEWPRVLAAWTRIKGAFESFVATGWKLDSTKGDLYANRYLASLIAFEEMAKRAGDRETADQAAELAQQVTGELIQWWNRVGQEARLPIFNGSGDLDRFIGGGGGLFFRVQPHRSKLALFADLTPEVAARIRVNAPQAVAAVWSAFEELCPTWYVTGEERQVHTGENYVDPPDFALSAFKALAWLTDAPTSELMQKADLPYCRADLAHLEKCALVLARNHAVNSAL